MTSVSPTPKDTEAEEATRMREALLLIAAGGCSNWTVGCCSDDPNRSPIAQYTAEKWCDECIAAHALGPVLAASPAVTEGEREWSVEYREAENGSVSSWSRPDGTRGGHSTSPTRYRRYVTAWEVDQPSKTHRWEVPAPPAVTAAEDETPTEEAHVWTDAEMTQALQQRDEAEEWADRLASTIARAARVDIGEHTSANNPWANALHESDRLIRDGGWVS